MNEMELDDATYRRIEALCDAGTTLFENDDIERALAAFKKAIELVPDPKTNWEAGIWLTTAIADCLFLSDDFDAAKEHFTTVVSIPAGEENPFVQLRLGQCLFELGEKDAAKDRLKAAFDIEGEVIFEGEDKKYRDFLG